MHECDNEDVRCKDTLRFPLDIEIRKCRWVIIIAAAIISDTRCDTRNAVRESCPDPKKDNTRRKEHVVCRSAVQSGPRPTTRSLMRSGIVPKTSLWESVRPKCTGPPFSLWFRQCEKGTCCNSHSKRILESFQEDFPAT